MTLTLILVRHAKSSWDDPLQDDHDRVLNARGRRSAPVMGRWLHDGGYIPDAVLCSSAARTRETWDLMSGELGAPSDLRYEPALYHAPSGVMMQVLKTATAPCVLMLGHNPGIADFAARLVARAPDHNRFYDYPTCATLVARFEADAWADIRFGTGKAVAFSIPADLGVK